MAEEFYLDWRKNELHGWEREKDDLSFVAIIEGIKCGCKFPAVDVVKRENVFEVAYGLGGFMKDYLEYEGIVVRLPIILNGDH